MISAELLNRTILRNIDLTLDEDIGSNLVADSGDITAQLIPETEQAHARVLTREAMVLAGRPWVDALFAKLDPTVEITWLAAEGDHLAANTVFLELKGSARSLLTGERPALNFIQTLSGVATRVAAHVKILDGLSTRLLDTRKTLPGLRIAEKYAVAVGGGQNHRLGLFDAFLIKENHILAAGSIQQAITAAHRIAPGKPVEVEVETFEELNLALEAGADIIMLDNFSNDDMRQAVAHTAGRSKLEASGNITDANLRSVAETGVDYISLGTLTKDVKAIDLSMRLVK
ncbi:carboxylating nicotinate-nucleotide diphosphorylase [Aquirhabdus parva]|uniref:Probable nicotinate-nucleotide pyrophosphorylase [carboxylating] n=1 Tax=Aquirhabdus parva TaxID=2283318 RepID=A0A345P8R3_9GAMM|nr:carboxylating nicotinate-nucleotide diphosphorylase [Aquirhabdus parva]AXI03672.1 carboxylating nicotinate-nucleotide diphosphorylase [Aquirhabdus parva]